MDPWNPDRRQLISELRPWQVKGEKLSSKDKSCLSTMKDEILNLNLNEQGSVVDCPSAFEVVRSRQRRCLSSRSSRSFQGAGLSPSQGESQVGGHSPGQGQTLLGTRSKVTGQMSVRFFQKLTGQQILNICTKKTGT